MRRFLKRFDFYIVPYIGIAIGYENDVKDIGILILCISITIDVRK